MKGAKITLAVVMGAIVVGLCILLGYSLSKMVPGRRESGDGDIELVREREFPADDISKLDIHYEKSCNDVIIYASEGDMVIVREFANYAVRNSELAKIKLSDSTLSVSGPMRLGNAGNNDCYMYTEMWLPVGYEGGINVTTAGGEIRVERELSLRQELKLSGTDGDITTRNVTAPQVSITSTGGELRLGELTADKLEIITNSGDVRIDRADGRLFVETLNGEVTVLNGCGERKVSTLSGDIKISGIDGKVCASATSGEVTLKGENGFGYTCTTSGNIIISITRLTGDMDIDATSGEVTLELAESEGLQFEMNTKSGTIDTVFDDVLSFSKDGSHAEGTIGDAGINKVDIFTLSGDIRVR